MDIDSLLRRQALMEWRDRWFTQAVTTINAAAIKAQRDFNAQLEEAGVADTVWDPDRFTFGRIDSLMARHLDGHLSHFLAAASEELRNVDERVAELAAALADSSSSLTLANASYSSSDVVGKVVAAEPTVSTPDTNSAKSPTLFGQLSAIVGDHSVTRAAHNFGVWASGSVATSVEAFGKTLQDKAGLYDRLRRKASERIATTWLGDVGTPLPLKAQLLLLIDDVNNEARSFNI